MEEKTAFNQTFNFRCTQCNEDMNKILDPVDTEKNNLNYHSFVCPVCKSVHGVLPESGLYYMPEQKVPEDKDQDAIVLVKDMGAAVIGLSYDRAGVPDHVIYDRSKVMDILLTQKGLSKESAELFLNESIYSVNWKYGPIFIDQLTEEQVIKAIDATEEKECCGDDDCECSKKATVDSSHNCECQDKQVQ